MGGRRAVNTLVLVILLTGGCLGAGDEEAGGPSDDGTTTGARGQDGKPGCPFPLHESEYIYDGSPPGGDSFEMPSGFTELRASVRVTPTPAPGAEFAVSVSAPSGETVTLGPEAGGINVALPSATYDGSAPAEQGTWGIAFSGVGLYAVEFVAAGC